MQSSKSSHWQYTMDRKISGLLERDLFIQVPRPKNNCIVPCHWHPEKTVKLDGSLTNYKAFWWLDGLINRKSLSPRHFLAFQSTGQPQSITICLWHWRLGHHSTGCCCRRSVWFTSWGYIPNSARGLFLPGSSQSCVAPQLLSLQSETVGKPCCRISHFMFSLFCELSIISICILFTPSILYFGYNNL